MSSKASHVHHGLDYVELAVTDMKATKKFYGAAFGWTFNDYGPDYVGYMDRKGSKEGGGFRLAARVRSGGPLPILYSRDLEATLTAVRGAGGKVVKKIFEFPGGRRFEAKDPSGNHIAVWSDR